MSSNAHLNLSGYDPVWNGLVAYYPFNGNVNDASGNGNNGVLNAGASYSTNRLGTANAAYVFDGSQGISVPNSISLNTGNQLTLSAWINFGLGGSFNPRIISKNGGQGYQLLTLGTGSQRQISFYAEAASDTTVQAVNADEWVCLTATFDGTNASIYINGLLDSSAAGSGVFSNANDLAIGENGDNTLDNFIGLMSDLRIYNRALASNDVATLYALEAQSTLLPPQKLSANLGVGPNPQSQPDWTSKIHIHSANNPQLGHAGSMAVHPDECSRLQRRLEVYGYQLGQRREVLPCYRTVIFQAKLSHRL